METINRVDQLLENLGTEHGEQLQLNRLEIDKELKEDAHTYKGLGIKLLSIAGGLLGTAFFLGFVFLSVANSKEAQLVLGILLMGGAILLNKASKSTILDAACIGCYLAGYAVTGIAMAQMQYSENFITGVLLAVAIITPCITSGFMLNFFSVLMISGCLFTLINVNDAYQLIHVLTVVVAIGYTYISLFEADLIAGNPELNNRYMAWLNGMLFSFIALLAYLGVRGLHYHALENLYVSAIVIIVVIGFLLHHVVRAIDVPDERSKMLIYIMGGLVLLPTIFAPAICGSLLIIFLSYSIGHRTGLIMGIMALAYFTGQYYYDLDYTLLVKSGIMLASGALFLAAWFILKKQLKRYEQN